MNADPPIPQPVAPGVPAWRRTLPALIASIALALALLACVLVWALHTRSVFVERELARQIEAAGTSGSESHALAKEAADQSQALQARVAVLESKLADSQAHEASLEQLYQDLARTRDDWALAQVEETLTVASQQLQLAGNVQGALTALQNADTTLSRSDRPQFIAIRRVIEHDIDKLRALPSVDVSGNVLRLDSLINMVDSLPLLADEKAAPPPRLDAKPVDRGPRLVPNRGGGTHEVQPGLLERADDAVRYGVAEAWQEFQELVRVRRVDQPDALLLSPSQSYFVRENLKLRLLNARQALLGRQEEIYRSDLVRAEDTLDKYFDTRSRQTVAALTLLKQIEATNTVVALPTLADSLNAVRNYKGPR